MIECDRFPAVAEGQATEGGPGETRPTSTATGANAAAEAAGRAQRGAGEEAPALMPLLQILDHWQTLTAGILALGAAGLTVWATIRSANRQIGAAQ